MERLVRSGSNKLLVVDGGQKLEGIITMMDLVTTVQNERTTVTGICVRAAPVSALHNIEIQR